MTCRFNQNCQLIIEELPDKEGYNNVIEIVRINEADNTFFEVRINRTDPFIIDVPQDGWYLYFKGISNDNLEELTTNTAQDIENIIRNFKQKVEPLGRITKTDIFSICKLRQCVLVLEKLSLEEFFKNCKSGLCDKRNQHQAIRDTMLVAIFILEHLIRQGRFAEARNILESLNSCGDLCGDIIINRDCCNG